MEMNNFRGHNCTNFESLNGSASVNCTSTSGTGEDFTPLLTFTLPQLARMFQALAYIVEFILGIILSLFFIFLTLCRKSLRQRGFAVALQILLVNLAFAIPVLSTSVHAALEDDWVPDNRFCHFIAFCNQSFQPQRWFLIASFVIDRVLTIHRPLTYEKHGAKIVAILSMCALILALLFGTLPRIIIPTCTPFVPPLNTCQFTNANRKCAMYGFLSTTTFFLLGGVLPFCLYVWIFHKAKKASRRVVPTQQLQISTIPSHLTVTRKQLVTVFILFWTLLGCSLPYYLSFVFLYVSIQLRLPNSVTVVAILSLLIAQPLYYGLVIADPIALMWHQDVKQELRKIRKYIRTTLFNFTNLQPTPTSSTS